MFFWKVSLKDKLLPLLLEYLDFPCSDVKSNTFTRDILPPGLQSTRTGHRGRKGRGYGLFCVEGGLSGGRRLNGGVWERCLGRDIRVQFTHLFSGGGFSANSCSVSANSCCCSLLTEPVHLCLRQTSAGRRPCRPPSPPCRPPPPVLSV